MVLTGQLSKVLLSTVLVLGLSGTAFAQRGGGRGGGGGGGSHGGGGYSGGASHSGGGSYGGGSRSSGSGRSTSGGVSRGSGSTSVGHGTVGRGTTSGRATAGRGTGSVSHGSTRSVGTIHGANGHSARVPSSVSRGGRTYNQRIVNHGGHQYVQRSYGGHRGYYSYNHWGRYGYYGYCHNFGWAWGAGFWGWYGLGWAPWYYSWGWYSSPWFGWWGWYYHPYPYYIGASYYVTDYVLSQELQDEYDRGYSAGQSVGNANQKTSTPISDSDKEQVRKQVDQVSNDFKSEKSVEVQAAFADSKYLFIVDTDLSVTPSNSSAACKLAGGDIIKVAAAAPTENDSTAQMVVVTAKGGSCPAGTQVTVSISDLQEMLNSFGEKVDNGLQEAQKHKSEIKTSGGAH